ncbi:MAG: methyltransferase domain-containing protein [Pseudomonadales bacterium]|nr:methyltransferase domain-containing protein [Pseudomonadales bacterium]
MADSSGGARIIADYSEWRARDYFQTYYSEVVLPDEQAVLAYQVEVLRAAGKRFGRGLEYGCGPTLHRAIAASKYAFRLDMADWLADNLAAARDWLLADIDNPDWKQFTQYLLACEGQIAPTNRQIDQREAQTRKVVRGLYLSDARWQQPLGPQRNEFYDLIVSGFCLDAVSDDQRVWRRCMQNLLSMLQPGGTLIIHALHRCRAYKCGDRMFPGADLSMDDMQSVLLDGGCTQRSIDVQVIPCPNNAIYGYSGILTASAQKAPG